MSEFQYDHTKSGSFLDQQLSFAKQFHQQRFAFALGDLGATPITVEDLSFAEGCSRDQLFVIAAAMYARARLAAEGVK